MHPPPLDLLPVHTGGAAENMAADFLLLQRYPNPAHVRFRHYDWHRPAFTFGYGQKIAYVRAQLPPDDPVELCRRPTGGGVVDHRNDWTYSLVIPRGHDLYGAGATLSYRIIHEAIAAVLRAQGVPAMVKAKPDESGDESVGSSLPGVCFERAEVYDVLHEITGAKIAGAAQKRNKHGLLFQGSLLRTSVGMEFDWDAFHGAFAAGLALALAADLAPAPWPDFAGDELEALTEHYASSEWNGYR
jgi:lipoate-protein ligase A